MTNRSFWKSFRLFAPLPPEALEALAAAAQPHRWSAGETIFQRGDPGDWLLAIETGRIRVSLGTASGRELVLRQAGPGEILGELALFDAEPRSADATAAEATTVGGLVTEWLGHVPRPGETVQREGVEMQVIASDQRRVERVRVRKYRNGNS